MHYQVNRPIIVGQRYNACCPPNRMSIEGAACVHYLAGKKSINVSGKCHSGLARQENSKIYACCPGTSLTVLVSDRNSVSVPNFGRKYRFRYRYRSRNYFFRNWNFFFFFSKFFMYFYFLGECWTWNWTQIFKSSFKILKILQQIWFKGFFYDWKKKTPYYW